MNQLNGNIKQVYKSVNLNNCSFLSQPQLSSKQALVYNIII